MVAALFVTMVLALMLFLVGYGIVSIAKDLHVPQQVITVPLGIMAGLLVVMLIRSVV